MSVTTIARLQRVIKQAVVGYVISFQANVFLLVIKSDISVLQLMHRRLGIFIAFMNMDGTLQAICETRWRDQW